MNTTNNYTEKIDTFIFRRVWGEAFKILSDEQAGKLIKAIYLYTEGEEMTLEDTTAELVYKIIVKQLNRSARRYITNCGLSNHEE